MPPRGKPVLIDITIFVRSMKALEQRFKPEKAHEMARNLAQSYISDSINAPIPTDLGELAASGSVQDGDAQGEVVFGFNKEYASFQNLPRSGEVAIIRPKRKKKLYIPLTRRGRLKHQYGANPAEEGLVRGVDYVLKDEVTIKAKPYGSDVGPNRYFTGTLERRLKNLEEDVATLVEVKLAEVSKRFKGKKLNG